jgi:hypothetical protein
MNWQWKTKLSLIYSLSTELTSVTGVFFKFDVEVGVVNAPPDYNSDQLFQSNLTFCVVSICNLKNQSFFKTNGWSPV